MVCPFDEIVKEVGVKAAAAAFTSILIADVLSMFGKLKLNSCS